MPDGGAIVNLASRAALGSFGQANYAAAKSGLIALTRALALRWAPRIRVNALAPGLVDTPMTAGMPPEVLDQLVARVPAGRMGTPAEMADVVAFLASPAASYITGQVLLACGGRSVAV
jgi:NAD(P)-dependent dehydrogenase (short-subunit alcohol dehydrogenase family)